MLFVSNFSHGVGVQTLGSLFGLVLNFLPLIESSKALTLDGRVVHEDVTPVSVSDESVALCVVEPFNRSLEHTYCSSLYPPYGSTAISVPTNNDSAREQQSVKGFWAKFSPIPVQAF